MEGEEQLNIPISTTEDYEELYGEIEENKCPECESNKVVQSVFFGDDHKQVTEFECKACGATWETK